MWWESSRTVPSACSTWCAAAKSGKRRRRLVAALKIDPDLGPHLGGDTAGATGLETDVPRRRQGGVSACGQDFRGHDLHFLHAPFFRHQNLHVHALADALLELSRFRPRDFDGARGNGRHLARRGAGFGAGGGGGGVTSMTRVTLVSGSMFTANCACGMPRGVVSTVSGARSTRSKRLSTAVSRESTSTARMASTAPATRMRLRCELMTV